MPTRSMSRSTFRPTWRGCGEAKRCSGGLQTILPEETSLKAVLASERQSREYQLDVLQLSRAMVIYASTGHGGRQSDVMRVYFESGGECVVRGTSYRWFGPVSEARGWSNPNLLRPPRMAFRSMRPWLDGPYCGPVLVTRTSTVYLDGRGGGSAAVATRRSRQHE
jgi:hypothetical protein